MLSKEAIATLATLAKIPVDQLTAALATSEETPVTIAPTLKAYEDAEILTLGSNKYNEGKLAGVEMGVKDAREKLGLDFQGKNIDALLTAHAEKVKKEAGIPKDQQMTELTNQIATLTGLNSQLSSKLADKEVAFTGIAIDTEIVRDIPGVKADVKISQHDVLGMMKMKGYTFKREDAAGPIKAYLNGQLIVDKLGSPLPVKEAVTGFMTDLSLISDGVTVIPTGRGPADKNVVVTGTAKTMTELKAQFTAAGKHLAGAEFMAAADAAMKDKNFDASK